MKAAWDETRGQVLMYDGRLILTPYHRLSNGKTRSGNEVFGSEEYPYLQSRECPEDVEAKEEMTVSMIQGSDMEVTGTDNAGYVTRVTAKGIGHGLGMSQYTAKKMAEEGKSCEEILQYFFTDVSLEEVTDIVIEKNEKGE